MPENPPSRSSEDQPSDKMSRESLLESQLESQLESLLRYKHEFRVAYHQTDGQRRVHHSNYLNYFEDARVEMLRAGGITYKSVEDEGCLLVVTEMNVQYFAAAEFDDRLSVEVEVIEIRKVRLSHQYRVLRGETLIATGQSTIACVGPEGKPKKLPQPFLDFAAQIWPKKSSSNARLTSI